jgi:hypothetical protein
MAAPDLKGVIDGALRAVAIVASAFIALGFVLFAVNEVSHASREQQTAVDAGTPSERLRESRHSPVREFVDDANDHLLGPFTGWVPSGNDWVRRGVPALLGLLVYGLGLGFLARCLQARD